MALYSYNATLSEDRDRVRFWIGDTVLSAGPLPADANFYDEEIDGLLSAEGTWQRAVAAAFEALAARWRRYPTYGDGDFKLNRSDIAKGYDEQAAQWRKRYGSASGATRMGSRSVTRVDGYSSDRDNVTA